MFINYFKGYELSALNQDKQHKCPLGACLKCRISDPTSDILDQYLHFNKILR